MPNPQVQWLTTGIQAFEAMMRAIGEARRQIIVESYIWGADQIGIKLRDALCAAALRGCQVRVLVDSFGSLGLATSFWEPLISAGGDFRWFNPLTLSRATFRNHRKLLVADDAIAFIGGFNIADEWNGDGVRHGWRDIGLQLSGEPVIPLRESFDRMFDLADFQHKHFTRLRKPLITSRNVFAGCELLFTGPGRAPNPFKVALHRDLAQAEEVRIVAAYFLPTWRIRRDLILAARRGCKVQLILAGKSDVPLMRLAARCLYQRLLQAGAELFEYQPQILHSKMVLIDNRLYLGSANMDTRSFQINYELVLALENPALTAQARDHFADYLQQSRPIVSPDWKHSRGFWDRWMERLAYYVLARLDPYVARWQWRALR